MIDEIRKYMEECPLFSGNSIKVNYLGDKTVTYSIETVPANPVIKNYADGGKLCQVLFVIASRELYSKSDKNNTAVMKFYEDFSAWIEAQDKTETEFAPGYFITREEVCAIIGRMLNKQTEKEERDILLKHQGEV